MLKKKAETRTAREELLAFHTGLMPFDYYRFPHPPYRGKNWHLDLVLPPDEFEIGSASVNGKTYPAKEVMIWAADEAAAQRAADLIHAARLLLDGCNTFSHIYPGDMPPFVRREQTATTN